MASKTDTFNEVRALAEADLLTFIRLVHPHRVLGSVHEELIRWWCRQDAKSHQLTLLPRDHGKSAMIAYRVAWEITRNPAVRILYISSTANLAEKQLKFIKDILTSKIYRRYWPEMVNEDEGKREKWTSTEISVDHPKRKAETVRDPTIFTAGLTTGIVGMHCDIAVLDDVVVGDNASTQEGRSKVKTQYSFLSSIEGTGAREWVVGTRYHPQDLYNDLLEMQVDIFSEDGEIVDSQPLYEVFERVLEDSPSRDGTGQYLWPKMRRADGKWFGFDQRERARKYAQYLDKTQFWAQYYNDPNDRSTSPIDPDSFQYYNRALLQRQNGLVYFNGTRLNVYAAVDFAFALTKKADYTSVVVVGIDPNNNYYILDIDRFKSDRISDYYNSIFKLHQKWGFRKLRAEVVAAQAIIVQDLKENYIKPNGLALSIDEFRPNQGTKEERIAATLYPRYDNRQIWHYKGGNCQILEEELIQEHPPHDDVKDALAAVIPICQAPTYAALTRKSGFEGLYNKRFGGIG